MTTPTIRALRSTHDGPALMRLGCPSVRRAGGLPSSVTGRDDRVPDLGQTNRGAGKERTRMGDQVGSRGSAPLKSAGLGDAIRRIEVELDACLTRDGVISLEAYRRRVRPAIRDAEGQAIYVHRGQQAAIHLLKETVDVENTRTVLARAGVLLPFRRREAPIDPDPLEAA